MTCFFLLSTHPRIFNVDNSFLIPNWTPEEGVRCYAPTRQNTPVALPMTKHLSSKLIWLKAKYISAQCNALGKGEHLPCVLKGQHKGVVILALQAAKGGGVTTQRVALG